ncbi:hypothetical protein SS50377_24672 [Spironucleus salmonicida]|uniref:Uncharacterized protein n=1 Tax=Spironucleus salmonicida TaxID=348837 RepID=V6LL64_9EUKA|nr:hypothetical protein SS50377_24672 [Spironucleus salmonicida]|eukprot:EST44481.1 Hypothetical protein SS50377_15478 [Spironucleus salmonicida]
MGCASNQSQPIKSDTELNYEQGKSDINFEKFIETKQQPQFSTDMPKLDNIGNNLDLALEKYKVLNSEQERKVTSILKMGLPSTSFDYYTPDQGEAQGKHVQLETKLDCDVDSIQEEEDYKQQ